MMTVTSVSAALQSIDMRGSPDILVFDTRAGGAEACRAVHERFFPEGALSGPVLPERTLVLVEANAEGAELAFEFGKLGVGHAMVDPELPTLLDCFDRILDRRGKGRIAICLAGGGIEGLLWELGVLRALDACLVDRSVIDIDFFCGISAGAIVASLLANGVDPATISEATAGASDRIDPITRWTLFDVDVREYTRRLRRLVGQVLRGGEGPRGIASSLARAVPPAVFGGNRLERWLEKQLTAPGMANRFADLRRPLYVGATDQDTSQAALFSHQTTPDVPIHRAVRASCALVPFYAPTEIEGRWYVDGAFSRTTNMRVAVEAGATLVLLIDPLIPVHSEIPGHVHTRGGIYSSTQALKALINGRFTKAVDAIAAVYPDVAFHLFRPTTEDMRILAGSPMKFLFRREVEDIAYKTTLATIANKLQPLRRDFAIHGVQFRLPPEPSLRQMARQRELELDLDALGIESAIEA